MIKGLGSAKTFYHFIKNKKAANAAFLFLL
jgi:hypothetical protein